MHDSTTITVGTVQWNGTNMIQGTVKAEASNVVSELWYLAGASGAGSVVYSLSAGNTGGICTLSYTGVKQTTPLDATGWGTDSNGTAKGTITTVAADAMVIMCVGNDNNGGVGTPGANQTERADFPGDSWNQVLVSEQLVATAGQIIGTYTFGATPWSVTMISLQPVTDGGAVTFNSWRSSMGVGL